MRRYKLMAEELQVDSFVLPMQPLAAEAVPETEDAGCGGGGGDTGTFVTYYYTDCAGRTIQGAWGTCP